MANKKNVPSTSEPNTGEAASVAERIESLRQKAKAGELDEELLEEVAGGHVDGQVHTDSVKHTNAA